MVYKLQSIYPKQKSKTNKYADFKLKEEATRNAKKNKKYFINVIEIYSP